MLERIVNIAPGSDFQKSSAKTARYNRSAQFLHTLNTSMNDSISLSPATSFLSSVHWRLKKFVNEKEKTLVVFEFDGFEFTAALNQSGMITSLSVEYEIKKAINKLPFVYNFKLWLESKNIIRLNEKFDVLTQLPYLNAFANQLVNLNDYSLNISVDKTDVREAFNEIEKSLNVEFDYLNGCLIGFLEKYLSLNFNVQSKRESFDNLLLRNIEITKL